MIKQKRLIALSTAVSLALLVEVSTKTSCASFESGRSHAAKRTIAFPSELALDMPDIYLLSTVGSQRQRYI